MKLASPETHAHSPLGGSGIERWLNCPGSVRKIAALPESCRYTTSVYAEEGSASHKLSEVCLRTGLNPTDFIGHAIIWNSRLGEYFLSREPYDGLLGEHEFIVDDEMATSVKFYTDFCRELIADHPDATYLIEHKFHMKRWNENFFGTSDFALFEDFGELHVVDYKHGAGVPVSPYKNRQNGFYANGVIHDYGENFSKVFLHIVQPRLPNYEPVRTWETSMSWLADLREEMISGAAEALFGDAPVVPGRAQCMWCPALPTCEEARNKVTEEVGAMFTTAPHDLEVHLLKQVGQAYAWVPFIKEWCSAVATMALERAKAGTAIPGFHLEKSDKHRKWRDPDETVSELVSLIKAGLTFYDATDILTQPSLKSPAQLEKVKGIGKEWVADRTFKPEGDPKLVADDESFGGIFEPADEFSVGPVDETDF